MSDSREVRRYGRHPFEFRCRPGPVGDVLVQQCTFCGAPGHWTGYGDDASFTPPNNHSTRDDGTLDCPRSVGDRAVEAPRWDWTDGEATRFLNHDGTEWDSSRLVPVGVDEANWPPSDAGTSNY